MKLFLLLMMAASAAHAADCPGRVPAGLSSVSIGDQIVVDGKPMSIVQVQGAASPEKIMADTEAAWKKGDYLVKRNSAAGWEILSALGDKCMVTLQLVERNGSFGYLSRNHDPKSSKALTIKSAAMPVPDDARILSEVASNDDGRPGLTVAMVSALPLERLSLQMHRQLERENWGAITMRRHVQTKNGASSLKMSAQRERRRIDITAWADGGSKIVMTVSSPL